MCGSYRHRAIDHELADENCPLCRHPVLWPDDNHSPHCGRRDTYAHFNIFALFRPKSSLADGEIKPSASSKPIYGNWNPDAVSLCHVSSLDSGIERVLKIFIVWTLAGLAYGMVELIRRVMCV